MRVFCRLIALLRDGPGLSIALVASVILIVTTASAVTPPSGQAYLHGQGVVEAQVSPSAIFVSGTIATDTTWTLANSPYEVVNDTTIAPGAKLTIEPGVVVQFRRYSALAVDGTLAAVGTGAAGITFRGTSAEKGWWDGIAFLGESDGRLTGSQLSYVTVEHGGYHWDANVYLRYATVSIDHSTFRASDADGIYGFTGGLAHLSSSTFADNARYAVYFSDGSVNPTLTGLAASGNGTDAVAMGAGTLGGSHIWENSGIPYQVADDLTVGRTATLTIEPGVVVQFERYSALIATGRLKAEGTSDQRIVFTGTRPQAGWWDGIAVRGTSAERSATAVLNHVTVQHGGYHFDSNLYVTYGQLTVADSIVRQSDGDGVRVGTGAGIAIEASHIVENAVYGVNNLDPTQASLASNNWWGDRGGPRTDGNCNPGGAGSRISSGVAFRPFLASATEAPHPLSPSDARMLSVTPERWFVPADSISRAWVTISLKDGNGHPLPGRKVRLTSTHGNVYDGGITDVQGKTRAYVTATTAGEAQIIAELDIDSACESARSASATITFQVGGAEGGLLVDEQAPYLSNGLEISPMPITRGVPTRLRAHLTNPNDFPIAVDGTFGYAQLGIGLAFGPVGTVTNKVIPARGTGVIEVFWTPSVSGHYCVQFDYTSRAVGAGMTVSARGSGRSQRNINVSPAPFLDQPDKDLIEKAKRANDAIDDGEFAIGALTDAAGVPSALILDQFVGNILDFIYEGGGGINCALAGGTDCKGWNGPRLKLPGDSIGNLMNDPPSQDYESLAPVEEITFPPLQAGPNMPAARAAAINALVKSSLDLETKLIAAVVSYDRYAGAAEADDLQWSSLQANAYLHYLRQSAEAMIATADKWDALQAQLKAEGYTDVTVSADSYRAYQNRLRTQGFTDMEKQAARLAGLTDAGIEAALQARIALDPTKAAGSMFAAWTNVANALRAAGNAIIAPPAFGMSVGVSAGLTGVEVAGENLNLVRATESSRTIEVGNPTSQTAVIDLRVRRVDLPPDWVVIVSPAQVTLAAGAQTTVTVTVRPGSSGVQGTHARVAVEGYVEGTLIGGVVSEMRLPHYQPFDGKLRIYVPLVRRN